MDLENRKVDEWEIETQRIKCPRGQILQGQGPCWARNIGMSSLAIQVVKILHFHCRGHGFCSWPMNHYSTSLMAQPKIIIKIKINRKKKKKTETQVAKSRFVPGRETVTASRHIALRTISDCQSLNMMNSGSVGHCLGKRGLPESTAGGPHLPLFSGHKSRWFWEWKTKLQAPDKWIVKV